MAKLDDEFRKELQIMGKIVDILEGFDMEQKQRIMGSVAFALGDYDMAQSALTQARLWQRQQAASAAGDSEGSET